MISLTVFRMNEAQIEQEVMVELYERMIVSCHNKCIGEFVNYLKFYEEF